MLKNHFKIAFRLLLKNKAYGFINIFGLAAGTLCCLYILLYTQDQGRYDRHQQNAEDIYRVTSTLTSKGDKKDWATSSPPIAPAMKNDFGEVLQFTRVATPGLFGYGQHLLRYKDKSFYEKDVVFADSTFFDVFTYHFVAGNASEALNAPYSIVLLKTTADKLFGNTESAIGKLIEVNNAFNSFGKHDFKVTGVVDESLGRSHLHANMFISMASGGIGEAVRTDGSWIDDNFVYSYVKLAPRTNLAVLEKKFPAFLEKYGAQQMKTTSMQKALQLQPIASIHTSPGYEAEMGKTISPSLLDILSLIAILIQIIACINFMNLSTARASKRAKEVGVRKVVGAARKDLIKQFLSESFLLSLIGILIALPLLILIMPYLNEITQTDIHLSLFKDHRFLPMLAGLVIITGFVAGSYPAFYISAFRPAKVIKGSFSSHISASGLRQSLVVFQFIFSIVLITSMIIVYSQLNYIKNKDIGFEKDQKLIFTVYTDEALSKLPSFMNDLRQLSEVSAVSKSDNYPSQFITNDMSIFAGQGDQAVSTDAYFISTDENFVKATGMKILSGDNFKVNDKNRVLINETLARNLGLSLNKVEETRIFSRNAIDTFEVAGIVRDYNFNSLHENIKPLMIMFNPYKGSNLIVSANNKNYPALIGKIEAIWHKDIPEFPFDYAFLNDKVQMQYETESILSRIIDSFTLMAILISCLGLFGLAAFNAEQRNKEIGIRKILGASIQRITKLLSKDFLKLIVIALIIGSPIAWWIMDKWLHGFAYRVNISWWMFTLGGGIALFIAMFIVCFQAIKAAIANPVKSLKAE